MELPEFKAYSTCVAKEERGGVEQQRSHKRDSDADRLTFSCLYTYTLCIYYKYKRESENLLSKQGMMTTNAMSISKCVRAYARSACGCGVAKVSSLLPSCRSESSENESVNMHANLHATMYARMRSSGWHILPTFSTYAVYIRNYGRPLTHIGCCFTSCLMTLIS